MSSSIVGDALPKRTLSFFECLKHPIHCPNHFKPSTHERVLTAATAACAVLFGAIGVASETPIPYISLASLSLLGGLVLRRHYHYKNVAAIAQLTQGPEPKEEQKPGLAVVDQLTQGPKLKQVKVRREPPNKPLPDRPVNNSSFSQLSLSSPDWLSCPSTSSPVESSSSSSSSSSSTEQPTRPFGLNIIDPTLQMLALVLERCMKRIEAQLDGSLEWEGIFRISVSVDMLNNFMTVANLSNSIPESKETEPVSASKKKKSVFSTNKVKSMADMLLHSKKKPPVESHKEAALINIDSNQREGEDFVPQSSNEAILNYIDRQQREDGNFIPCLLKKILRERYRLIPDDSQALFVSIGKSIISGADESAIITGLRGAIDKLPAENRVILKKVVKFLHRVSLHGEKTKMPASNIAKLLGQCIFEVQAVDEAQAFDDVASITKVTEFMMEKPGTVFAPAS